MSFANPFGVLTSDHFLKVHRFTTEFHDPAKTCGVAVMMRNWIPCCGNGDLFHTDFNILHVTRFRNMFTKLSHVLTRISRYGIAKQVNFLVDQGCSSHDDAKSDEKTSAKCFFIAGGMLDVS